MVPSDVQRQQTKPCNLVGTNIPTQIPMRTGSPYFLAEAAAKSNVVPMRIVSAQAPTVGVKPHIPQSFP